MPKLSSTLVNQALAAAGHAERLVRGKGYWYFAEGNASRWPSSSVYVYRITDLTLDEWLTEHRTLAARCW